jgi:hypothetical protein
MPFSTIDGFHLQFVDISAIVVFGIGDRGLKNLLDDLSTLFWAEASEY